ncbi:hypothetical protein [Leucobacter sp. USHLN153]|uniref:hypothetical protein n=1 Tax=Leucobacter sp. USHLN153 TaxID=3081268 RepID=UPI003018A8C6
MSQPAPSLRRIALDAAGTRHDLVVPQNTDLAGALAAVGVHLVAGERVLGPDGGSVDAGTAAAELREGGLYSVAGLPGEREESGPAIENAQRLRTAPWALTGFGVGAALLATLVPEMRWIAVAVLALASLGCALVSASRAHARSEGTIAAVVLAAFAAALAVLPQFAAEPVILLAIASSAVAVLAALLAFMATAPRLRAGAVPLVVIAAAFAALAFLSPALGWSAPQMLIVAAAAATIGLRAAPSMLVGVDPGYHIDYGRFMVLRWTVRGRVPESIERVDADRVRGLVSAVEARLEWTVVILSVVAAAGIPAAIVPLHRGGTVERIAAVLCAIWIVLGLVLTSRRMAAVSLRTPPRLAAIVGLLLLALLGAPHLTAGGSLLAAGALLVAGAATGVSVLSLARGERSLGWSRTGDIVDSIAIALVLPAGVLAAGTLNLLQGVLAA